MLMIQIHFFVQETLLVQCVRKDVCLLASPLVVFNSKIKLFIILDVCQEDLNFHQDKSNCFEITFVLSVFSF
jgi:hypothetical protein